MRARAPRAAVMFLALAAASAEGQQPVQPAAPMPVERLEEHRRTASADLALAERRYLHFADDQQKLDEAAEIAWRYVKANYIPSTGLVAAVPNYDYATIWDLASSLAAIYCAGEMNMIDRKEADARLILAMQTLAGYELYQDVAFNKVYSVTSGAMVDRAERRSQRGYGWSTTDLGRLLVWLRILGTSRESLSKPAEAVVQRLKFDRLVQHGYLWGEDLDPKGAKRRYQEGQMGYEQYAARGFALWGHPAAHALDFDKNALPFTIMGQPLVADLRQRDRLTSDPFVLSGLELGWEMREAPLARAVLAAQEERFKRTGIVTIVGEDAMTEAPHFFYYYGVFTNNRAFGLDVQTPGVVVDGPRWVSTKAAFGWHALAPSAYTLRAVETVRPAAGSNGWASGVYERGGSTNVPNINTAAVVLEAALFERLGRPLLREGR
ncbi:MAG: DUF3131 domain-containing protein [Acidobacteriota bacterium]|nr:DUF3131 domain-containing protein [Acidobacteriota bacterium]